MSNLALYMIGAVLVAAAVGFGAHKLGVAPFWIGVVVVAPHRPRTDGWRLQDPAT